MTEKYLSLFDIISTMLWLGILLFIVPYPHDRAPSQRFRFEQYLKLLDSEGFTIDFYPFLSEKDWAPLYKEVSFIRKAFIMMRSFWKRLLLLFRLRKYDYIFIHREAAMIGPPILEFVIAKVLKRKYIYVFDDAIWLPNYSESNAKFHRLKAYGKVRKITAWADQVVTGNSFLAEFARQYNSNVRVIPTTIDLSNVYNKKSTQQEDIVRIGWTGSHTTMQYLPMLVPVLEKLQERYSIQFRVISNQPPEISLKCLEYIPWNKATEIGDLTEIHIGVMPLEDSIWAKGKCGFKGLQYMALQIPAELSNIGVNNEIISNGENGFLCANEAEWLSTLERLIQDIELRKTIGKAGLDTVKKRYSVAANKKHYLDLFQ